MLKYTKVIPTPQPPNNAPGDSGLLEHCWELYLPTHTHVPLHNIGHLGRLSLVPYHFRNVFEGYVRAM